MAPNLLFWAILSVLSAAAAVQAWALRRRREEPLGGDALDLDALPEWPLKPQNYSIGAVDVMASQDRTRAVVSVELNDEDSKRRKKALKLLGHELFRRLTIDAVLVISPRPEGEAELFLFAADGRGWWGREVFSEGFGNVEP